MKLIERYKRQAIEGKSKEDEVNGERKEGIEEDIKREIGKKLKKKKGGHKLHIILKSFLINCHPYLSIQQRNTLTKL